MKSKGRCGSISVANLIVWISLITITAISVGLTIWLSTEEKSCIEESFVHGDPLLVKGARLSVQDRKLSILNALGSVVLDIQIKTPVDARISDCGSNEDKICLGIGKDHTLSISKSEKVRNLLCTAVQHTAPWYDVNVQDCINMKGSHWYGGAQVHTQTWPMETWNIDSKPYVPGDSFNPNTYGGVLERYWLSSARAAVYVQADIPLFVSTNSSGDGSLCLMSRFIDSPYSSPKNTNLYLSYGICQSAEPNANLVDLHKDMAAMLWQKPLDIPSEDVIRNPIWSTWAMYKRNINSSSVLAYVQEILSHNMSASQIEIDDDWTPKYGDLIFDSTKFPDARALITKVKSYGFSVTAWVHPFANIDSKAFAEAAGQGYLLKGQLSTLPSLTYWWNGIGGILDVTNTDAVAWYQSHLSNLTSNYGIDSFKFDAGEANWLPEVYTSAVTWLSPAEYTRAYAEIAYGADTTQRRQEVRVGWQTQELPIFVRMMDKISTWDFQNGLKTLIPSALTFGLIGYPFVLPDMIGGNAYQNVTPDRELYIRWLEANALLPSMQFSLVPWSYDDEVVAITVKYLALRDKWADLIVSLARNATVTGEPIVRPLWWIAPSDESALVISDEFLVGNDLLVAPVLEKGATGRNVYLPQGVWHNELTGEIVQGGKWIDCKAALDQLPTFTRQSMA